MSTLDEVCSICYDNLQNNPTRKLICNHIFHKECIDAWFSRNVINTCPYCRTVNTDFDIEQAIQSYINKYGYRNMSRNWILDKIRLINNTIPVWNTIIVGGQYKVSTPFDILYGIIYEKSEIQEYGNFYCKIILNNGQCNYYWSNLCHFELIN